MKEEIKELWLAALRSGEYQQGRGLLHPSEGAYCCLGVLCHLHSKAGLGAWYGEVYKSRGSDATGLPGDVQEWAGLDRRYPCINGIDISTLNDGSDNDDEYIRPIRRHTFAEIADLIEAHL